MKSLPSNVKAEGALSRYSSVGEKCIATPLMQ